jgi:hypothetical protein
MLPLQTNGRTSAIAWVILMTVVAVCYVSIFAGLLGLVGARTAFIVTFSAAMMGCIAALIYFASALHHVRGHGAR